tara:strand:- start:2076 stop:2777 length:702 start_codon:yes stop_codon:yes gene_type:complete
MTSTIHADKIMNSSGDQDSGVDLLVNDQVKLKTANTDRVTVTDATTTVANALAVTGESTLTGGAKVNTIKHTGGTTGITINTNGIVTKAAHPAFQAYYNSDNYCWTDTTDGNFDLQTLSSVRFNRGNHYNTTNHRFIAPVAGIYQFYGQFFTNYTSNYARGGVQIRVNGSAKTETWIGNYDTATSAVSSVTIELAANDYVQLYTALYDGNATSNNYSVYCGATLTYLSGHLVG